MNLYVHVPFCASKCRYCAFRSDPAPPPDAVRAYLRLLPREIALRGLSGERPDTVYVGGGTPSLLGPEGVAELLGALPRPAGEAEVTVECNPGDVTPALARALAGAGATRVSLGVQSFSDRALCWLGRRHDVARARAAFATLRGAGFRSLSIDLIAALPGEPEGEFAASLREAASLAPDHASVYVLSVEPGTPLARDGVRPAPDEAALAAVAAAAEALGAAGLERYEVSNYARPGFECRHNLAVWRGEDYAGVGPAAWSREGLVRRGNGGDFAAWRAALEAGRLPPAEVTAVPAAADEAERFATRARLASFDGPDASTEAGRRRLDALRRLAAAGAVRAGRGGRWSLTGRGFEVSDAIMAELA